jgi:2-polyprenyl-3-methyl-5-hydroxy-6-metoxy-1,4-benzoquinol methylase
LIVDATTVLPFFPKSWVHKEGLEEIPCDLCGAANPTAIYCRPDQLLVVRCINCGLLYVNPRPADSTLSSLYTGDYFVNDRGNAPSDYRDYFAEEQVAGRSFAARRDLEVVRRHAVIDGARVLEIGCATGEVAQTASQMGARVVGYDLSSDALAQAKMRYPNLALTSGSAHNLPFRSGSFDIVLAFELIEHLASPAQGIREISRVLRGDGIAVLTTPNANRGRQLGWDSWQGFHTSFEHLYFFDVKTLSAYLAAPGLVMVGTYSSGDGQIRARQVESFAKTLLRGMRLFGVVKRLYKLTCAPLTRYWRGGDHFHTLMIIAKNKSHSSKKP